MHDFSNFIENTEKAIIVGLSGGADSMALTHMLSQWSQNSHGPQIYAVTVDHGLRKESAVEAKLCSERVKSWSKVTPVTLRWEGKKPDSRIQEEARSARYDLLIEYALKVKAKYILVAHHQDDQAETFLIRLSKGSGLDGLAAMRPMQNLRDGLSLIRPLLERTHDELVAYCKENNIEWVEDPSNQNEKFLRPRLRASRKALEDEGLTSKRLSVTAMRLARAQEALEEITDHFSKDIVIDVNADTYTLNFHAWTGLPEDVRIRFLVRAFKHLRHEAQYLPRFEKIEALAQALLVNTYKRRSLGGCLIALSKSKDQMIFSLEENA